MSINEVIKIGKEVPTIWELSNFLSIWTVFGVIICSILVGLGISMMKNSVILEGILFIFVGLFAGVFLAGSHASEAHGINKLEHLENWTSEIVIPFIEDLPEEKNVELVQFVEKEPVSSSNGLLEKKLTTVEYLEDAEYGELKYIENGIEKSERGWFILEFIQTGEPSYSYKEVTDDLSESITKGAFNKTLTLPSDKYDFEGTNVIYFNKE